MRKNNNDFIIANMAIAILYRSHIA